MKIVLTGGPCAGKTTALSQIKDRLEGLGCRVFLVPEAATLMFKGGLSFDNVSREGHADRQLTLAKMAFDLESRFEELAALHNGPSVVICDRGALDTKAFNDSEQWQSILTRLGVTEGALSDRVQAGSASADVDLEVARKGSNRP